MNKQLEYLIADITLRAQIGLVLGLIALALWLLIFKRVKIHKKPSMYKA